MRPRTLIDWNQQPSPQEFARALAVLRAAKGMSQKELAQAAGMAPSTISAFETGRKTPSRHSQVRLFEALGQDVVLLDELVDLVRRVRSGVPVPSTSREAGEEALPLGLLRELLGLGMGDFLGIQKTRKAKDNPDERG